MTKSSSAASVTAIIILEFMFMINPAVAVTVPSDVSALQELYKNLSYPPQLIGWKSDGGDPCVESWTGVSCDDGASVIKITLPGYGLGGYLVEQLNLPNLKELDLSSNNIEGKIPSLLTPDITYIDLSSNKFNSNIPQSFAFLKHLRHLNLSDNILSGTVGNYFSDLQNLKQMDLSHNNFTGDLPSSFRNLTSLTGLFLQNNQFTGSISFLANHPLLSDLNFQFNNFSDAVLKQFQHVPNHLIWANAFQKGADSPPWGFPLDTTPSDHASTPPTELSADESYHYLGASRHRKAKSIPVGIVHALVGVAIMSICAATVSAVRMKRSGARNTIIMLPTSTENVSKNRRRAYLQLRTALPMYLTVYAILFTLSLSCIEKWIFLSFVGLSGVFFVWMGIDACHQVEEMEINDKVCNWGPDNQPSLGRIPKPTDGGSRLTRFCCCRCNISYKVKVAIVTAFSVLYTSLLTVHVLMKACG